MRRPEEVGTVGDRQCLSRFHLQIHCHFLARPRALMGCHHLEHFGHRSEECGGHFHQYYETLLQAGTSVLC